MTTVLVVDDKEMLRDSVGVTLQRAGFTILAASGGTQALDLITSRRPDAVVTDLKMPGMTGVELVEKVREFDDDLPVVLMTAYGTVDTAVRAMKLGASDYITKPFEGDELVIAVKRALEHARLRRENAVLRASASPGSPVLTRDSDGASGAGSTPSGAASLASGGSELFGLDRIIGNSPSVRALKDRLLAVASSHGTVLISGESGVGKEVVSRAIHELSPRCAEPFLGVNCAAMSEGLLESELFGHEKGAFTGAERLRKGRFELAHRGTLLLDEISEVRPQVQAKLLRVLQERSFERVGASLSMSVDVRVIATTNRDLSREVERGGFRSDLYYRLNVLPLHLPALRERIEDVALLAPHFVREVCRREGRAEVAIENGAVELMTAYAWPGNVRELQNLCERAVVLCRGGSISADLVRGWLATPGTMVGMPSVSMSGAMAPTMTALPMAAMSSSPTPLGSVVETTSVPAVKALVGRSLEDIEREVIVETLHRHNGHRVKTARELGIGVRTLGLKLKKWKQLRLVEEGL
ncbi:MAG: sigma-54-dependent transcriptional regulator [Phycisphaerales bacterium]